MNTIEKLPLVGREILFVDDDEVSRIFFTTLLQNNGASVVVAKNGFEAIAALGDSASTVDTVITDLCMPEIDGFSIAKRCRALKRLSGAYLVGVTALDNTQVRKIASSKLFNSFFQKPVDVDRFITALSQYQNLAETL